jgi:hypothetical protein
VIEGDSVLEGQRLLGAVLHAATGVIEPTGGHFVDQQDTVAEVVGIEQVGCQHIAPAVALATIGVETDVHDDFLS